VWEIEMREGADWFPGKGITCSSAKQQHSIQDIQPSQDFFQVSTLALFGILPCSAHQNGMHLVRGSHTDMSITGETFQALTHERAAQNSLMNLSAPPRA
jgi:hypothetical protein